LYRSTNSTAAGQLVMTKQLQVYVYNSYCSSFANDLMNKPEISYTARLMHD